MENIELILSGVLTNFLMTILSCIIPIIVGTILICISRNNATMLKIIKAFSTIFESLSPVVLILGLMYGVFFSIDINRTIICILGFTISFLGYLPSRVREDYSFAKNIAVNYVGLFSTILKWSFCTSMVGVDELIHSSQKIMAITYNSSVYLITIPIAFFVVLILKIVKFVLEEKMQ